MVPGTETLLGEGLSYCAFDVPTDKKMRFPGAAENGRVVGYRITDTASGRSLVYLPGVQQLTPNILEELEDCFALLVDGTWLPCPAWRRHRRICGPSRSHHLSSCTLCFEDVTCSWLRSGSTA